MDDKEQKQKVEATFDTISKGYDTPSLRFFIKSADHLVKTLNFNGGERVIDVATGTGNVAIAAAKKLEDGFVTGIDLSDKMLDEARRKATEAKLTNIKFRRCDIENLDRKDGMFDLASCAFGIFFLPDMAKGLNCILKVIKPGGRFAMTSFNSPMMEPQSKILMERLKAYAIEPPTLSWKKINSPEKVSELLQTAGLDKVDTYSKQMGYYLKDADEWWNVLWNSGYRGILNQIKEEDFAKFKNDHLEEVDKLATKDGIWIDINVMFTVAHIDSN